MFEATFYYHAIAGETLAHLRSQSVEALLRREESALNEALAKQNFEAAASATLPVQELHKFLGRLLQVQCKGFTCAERDVLPAKEPLDRWSGDEIAPSAS